MLQTQPDGFLAAPANGKGNPVLVLHAWWGLNETIKGVCQRLADVGYIAFAPDLYHGKVSDTDEGAETLAGALDANFEQAKSDIAQAAEFLRDHAGDAQQGIAVIGFSLGAFYALGLAAADAEHVHSVVLFYGTGGGDFRHSRASFLGHFAENDPYEPQTNVNELEEALRSAGRPVTFYQYPETGHWFFEPDRVDAFDEAAAKLAWERTLAFLRGHSW